jgi:hypothetical protein
VDGYQSGRKADEDGRRSRCWLTDESVVVDAESREQKALRRKRRFMSQGLHLVFQITIALAALAMLVWSTGAEERMDCRRDDSDRIDAP